jgi:periplasmic protein CpxP/Spy
MERTKLLTIAVVGLLILNLLTIGFLILNTNRARWPEPPEQNRGGGPARIIIERLRLNEQQQQAFEKLRDGHHKQSDKLSKQAVELYRAYYELLTAEQPDTVQANELSRQIAQNQLAVAKLNFDHFAEIKALCRSDQQADFTRLVGDLNRLFGRQPRPRPEGEGPPPGDNSENRPPNP